jgi:hypothetical protein
MMTLPRVSLVLATSLLLLLEWPPSSGHAATSSAGCTVIKSIGIDTTLAGDAYGGNRGSAVFQTFVAPETLISSITVWRHPVEHFFENPLKRWILHVDSTATPNTQSVVLDGPLVSDGESLRPIDQIFEGLVGLKTEGCTASRFRTISAFSTSIC